MKQWYIQMFLICFFVGMCDFPVNAQNGKENNKIVTDIDISKFVGGMQKLNKTSHGIVSILVGLVAFFISLITLTVGFFTGQLKYKWVQIAFVSFFAIFVYQFPVIYKWFNPSVSIFGK